MVEYLTQIKSGIGIKVDVSTKISKNVMRVEKKSLQSEYKYL